MFQGKKKVTGGKQKARRLEAMQKKEIQILHLKIYKFSSTAINLKRGKRRVALKANTKTILRGTSKGAK